MALIGLSIVIPVYNEEKALRKTIYELSTNLRKSRIKYETIVVEDGSLDNSIKIAKQLKRSGEINRLVIHETNKGYGASLKDGIVHAKYNYIMITDADGTYPVSKASDLYSKAVAGNYSMVTANRNTNKKNVPFARRVPKEIILLLAKILTGSKIDDLNSGMRVFKKDIAEKYLHLYPNKWSMSTTLTIAFHSDEEPVLYIPIKYRKRIGKSSIKASDFFYFLILIVKLVVYFNPLRFFFWPGTIFTLSGGFWILFTLLTEKNITDTGLLVFLTGLQTSFFGLIADLIVKTRKSNEAKK